MRAGILPNINFWDKSFLPNINFLKSAFLTLMSLTGDIRGKKKSGFWKAQGALF